MTINFNNNQLDTQAKNLITLLEEKQLSDKTGIAVAVNNEVIQKDNWNQMEIKEHDSVMVITATQGG